MFDAFRRFFTQNFGLKILSLAVALLLWWTVAREPESQLVLRVPIEFYHVPQDLVFNSEVVPQAQIRVRGPQRVLRQMEQSDIHPSVDLAGATPGERTYNMTANMIRVPNGAEIEQIVPSQLRLNFDRPLQREVPVKARVTGTFAPGFHIVALVVQPDVVHIAGPAHRVDQIESVITDPVDATGVIGSATFTSNAYTTDPLVRISNPQPIRITVVTEKNPLK